jgi:hypothetical protein
MGYTSVDISSSSNGQAGEGMTGNKTKFLGNKKALQLEPLDETYTFVFTLKIISTKFPITLLNQSILAGSSLTWYKYKSHLWNFKIGFAIFQSIFRARR